MKRSLTALSLLIMSGAAFGQQAYSAKSLFFGEDGSVVAASTAAKPAAVAAGKPVVAQAKTATRIANKKTLAPKQIGASYFVRLKRADGSTEDVLASRSFRSGDRFQLGVKVNRPSYVYVMNQDPEGNLVQIFPVNGQDNYVNAMGTVFLPAKGAFEFDAKPGVEQLLVFLSPKPMSGNMNEQLRSAEPDMIAGVAGPAEGTRCAAPAALAATVSGTDDTRLVMPDTGAVYAAKGIAFKDDAPAACAAPPPAYAAKGIVFSDDPAPVPGGQVATYVVKKADAHADKNLFLKLKLNHQ
jgi:hypothetical protein